MRPPLQPNSNHKLGIIIDRIVMPIYIGGHAIVSLHHSHINHTSFISKLEQIVVPSLILALILIARPAQKIKVNVASLSGVLITYLVPLFFKATPARLNIVTQGATISATAYYLFLLFASYFSLGRNFGIMPTIRNVVSSGPYTQIRHPIYASYIHLAAVFTLASLTVRNVMLTLLFTLGFFLRLREEECVLAQDPAYSEYIAQVKNRVFSPIITSPLIIVFLTMFFYTLYVSQTRFLIL